MRHALQEARSSVVEERGRADRSEIENKRLQDKISILQRDKDVRIDFFIIINNNLIFEYALQNMNTNSKVSQSIDYCTSPYNTLTGA